MKWRIKLFLSKILLKLIDVDQIEQKLQSKHVDKMLASVTIGEHSRFYPEALVENLASNKQRITIGNHTHIRGELLVYPYGEGISIGDNCYIGKNTVIRAGAQIKIGNNVLIAHNVNIIDTDSHEIDYKERENSYKQIITKGHPLTRENINVSPILIEDNAWISYNVSILKGVKIGKGAIIGAGSVVTKDVPPFTLVAGNPATIIKDKLI